MQKVAFLFSGQGSQAVGMYNDIIKEFKIANDTFCEANESLGFDIKSLMLSGENSELTKSENAQPSVLTASIASFRVLAKNGITPDFVAGLSLGEYSAHVASGSLNFADAVPLVRKRGRFMNEAVPLGMGGMVALVGCDINKAQEICKKAQIKGIVEVANHNSEFQVVVSGENKALEYAKEISKNFGVKTIPLNVSAPFHCSLLVDAGEKLKVELDKIEFGDLKIPLISNVTANYVEKSQIKDTLVLQVCKNVRFYETLIKMIEEGVGIFIEIGPGHVVSNIVKKINKNLKVFSTNDKEEILKVISFFRDNF